MKKLIIINNFSPNRIILQQELNLSNIKAMMSRSSRLEEMKAALKRFNENKAKLNEVQAKNSEGESFTLEVRESCNSQDPARYVQCCYTLLKPICAVILF